MNREQELKEIREAIEAGNRTMQSLNMAMNALEGASSMGLLDLFGLDFIGGVGKHAKLNEAKNHLENAKQNVLRFQTELKDVSQMIQFNIDIGNFLTFADFFFDGFVADLLVQSKIGDAKKQVQQAQAQVQEILSDLYRMEMGPLAR